MPINLWDIHFINIWKKKKVNIAEKVYNSGEMFTQNGLIFKDAEKAKDLSERIDNASILLSKIAELEENTFTELSKAIE